VQRSNLWVWELGPVRFTVEPQLGARLVSLTYHGAEMLLTADAVAGTGNANNYGSTFWPSPQASWGWPPVPAFDSLPYTPDEALSPVMSATSGEGALKSGATLTLRKDFVPVPARGALDTRYRIHNTGEDGVTVAPWQITRVRGGGLTFFELGEAGIDRDNLALDVRDGVAWLAYDTTPAPSGAKSFVDATGWVAHVAEGLLLLQSFQDLAPGEAATGEAELELYANPERTYLEIEPQGRVETLASDAESKLWSVRWILRPLPAGMKVEAGSAELLALVREVLRE